MAADHHLRPGLGIGVARLSNDTSSSSSDALGEPRFQQEMGCENCCMKKQGEIYCNMKRVLCCCSLGHGILLGS